MIASVHVGQHPLGASLCLMDRRVPAVQKCQEQWESMIANICEDLNCSRSDKDHFASGRPLNLWSQLL